VAKSVKHHFAHAHRVHDGLEENSLILNLRADHDEKARQDEPWAVKQHAAQHDSQRDHLAESRGGAASRCEAVLVCKATA
jgi:hypothetical protein